MQADIGSYYCVATERFIVPSIRGFSGEYKEYLARASIAVDRGSKNGRVALGIAPSL